MTRGVFASLAVVLLVGACDQQPAPVAKAPAPPAPAPAPTWTFIHHTQGTGFYVTRPEVVGDMKRMWLGSINDKADSNGVRQTNALFEIDCKQNRVRFLQEDSYNREGNPISVEVIEDPSKWYYSNPDVVAYTVVEMGCGRKPITGKGYESLKDALKSDAPKGGAHPPEAEASASKK